MTNPKWIGNKLRDFAEENRAKGLDSFYLEVPGGASYMLMRKVINELGYTVKKIENIDFGHKIEVSIEGGKK